MLDNISEKQINVLGIHHGQENDPEKGLGIENPEDYNSITEPKCWSKIAVNS